MPPAPRRIPFNEEEVFMRAYCAAIQGLYSRLPSQRGQKECREMAISVGEDAVKDWLIRYASPGPQCFTMGCFFREEHEGKHSNEL